MAFSTTSRHTAAVPGTLRVLQIFATLTVLCILVQGVTAGLLVAQDESILPAHGGGALVLHGLSAVATVAAFLYWRASRGPLWPTIVSAVVLVGGFVQAYVGDEGVMAVHVPLALLLTALAVWVMVWALGPAARRR